MKIYLYLYDVSNLCNNIDLPQIIKEHTSNYKIEEKRIISESNYYRFINKTKSLCDINSFHFENGKPVINDLFISFSHSKYYYGFSYSNLLHGFDAEEIINEDRIIRFSKILKDNNDFNNSNDKSLFITKYWTEMESYSKLTGSGMDLKFIHNDQAIYKTYRIEDTLFTIACEYDFELEIYLNDEKRGIL